MEHEQLSLDYCYSCAREEPIPESGCYIYCLECGHVYKTRQDLLKTYNREIDRIHYEDGFGEPIYHAALASEIKFCPLCLHDF